MEINLEHISKAWPEAIFWKAGQDDIVSSSSLSSVDSIISMILCLGLILFFIFFLSRIFEGLISSFFAARRLKDLINMDLDPSIKTSRMIYLIFCTSMIFFICVNKRIVDYSFWEIDSITLTFLTWMIIIPATLFLKKLLLYILDWANSTTSFIRIYGTFLFYLGILYCILFPIILIFGLANSNATHIIIQIILVLSSAVYLLYIYRSIQIIISNGFSIFSFFIYLCTLEFLPLLILVKFFSNN